MFSIIKKTANVWHHTNDTQTVHLSTFGVVADITAQTFIVRALNGAFFPRQAVSINEIQVIDETGGGAPETFGTVDELLARLIQLQYPPYKTSGGGGGVGTLQEVTDNGSTTTNPIFVTEGTTESSIEPGTISASDSIGSSASLNSDGSLNLRKSPSIGALLIVNDLTDYRELSLPNESGTLATREWVEANPDAGLTADDITETATRVFVTPSEKTAITHANRSILDAITEAFTTVLKTAYDGAVAWIITNGANILNHIASTSNPHNVTKTQVGLGNVDNTSDVNKPISTDTQTALNTKVNKTNWVDISLTSTIVGFSSFSHRSIMYKVIDGMAFVVFYIEGVSNSANFSFTVPNNSTQGNSVFGSCGYNANNNTAQTNPARILLHNNSNIVTISVNFSGGNYSASGTKACAGHLIYKIN